MRLRELEVKGHFLTFAKSWVLERWGEGDFRRLLEALPSDVAQALRREPLPSTWFHHRFWCETALAVDRLFGSGDYALLEEGGRLHAQMQMDRIYPLIYRASPLEILENIGIIWRLNFRPGWARARLIRDGEALITFGGFEFERRFFPVWLGTKSFFGEIAERAGFEGEVEVEEPGPEDDWVVRLRWRWL